MTTRRPFVALLLAQIFALTGTRLSMIAIPWLVLTTTNDPMATGVVTFAEMVPYVVAKALGGPFIDRLGARTIAIAGDAASVFVVGLVPVLHALDALSILSLLPVVVVMGALRGPSDAANQAMVPSVAQASGLPLERLTGALGTVERLSSAMGAAAAGAIVAAVGPANALVINAAALAIAAGIIFFGIAAPDKRERKRRTDEKPNYRAELKEGWDFLRSDAVLVGIIVMVAMTNLFDQALAVVLLPVWAQATGNGAGAVGLVLAVMSGASVAGAALATGFAERLPRLTVYTVAFLVAGFPRFFVLALDVPTMVILVIVAVAGFASGFLNPIIAAVTLERMPRHLLGRSYSLLTALCWTLLPFGGLVGGALIAGFGLPAALAICGLAYLAVTMLPLGIKSFREFRVRPGADLAGRNA